MLAIPRDALKIVFSFTDLESLKTLSITHPHFYSLAREVLGLLGYKRDFGCKPYHLSETKFFRDVTCLAITDMPTCEQIRHVTEAEYAQTLKTVRILVSKKLFENRYPIMPDGVLELICALPKLEELKLSHMKVPNTFQDFSKLPPSLSLEFVAGLDAAQLKHIPCLKIEDVPEENEVEFVDESGGDLFGDNDLY